jgi:hypothetical protein
MNKIRIVTDSSAEFEPSELVKLGVECVPLILNFGTETFLDGEITDEAFYERLEKAEELPKTAQPSPEVFEALFSSAKEKGEEVVAVLIGSGLSGTTQSARIGMEMAQFSGGYIVDSESTVGVMQILVLEAVKMRAAGASAQEIFEALEALKKKICLFAVVDTLEYLRKGGRLSRTSSVIGTLLNIKPIVTIAGKVQVIGKALGLRKALGAVAAKVKENPVDPSYPVVYGYTKTEKNMLLLMDALKDVIDPAGARTQSVGAVVGTHAGPNVCVVIYVKKS